MKHMTTTALALAAALMSVPTAQAAVISYDGTAATLGDNSSPNTLTAFDGRMGSLNSATLQFNGTISGIARGAAASSHPPTVTVSPGLSLSSDTFGPIGFVSFASGIVSPIYADGGYSLSFRLDVRAEITLSRDIALSGDNLGRINYSLAGQFSLTPNPGEAFDNGAPFTGTTLVTYDFTPNASAVPEPASLMLLGFGLTGMAVVRRRLRN